MDIAALQAELAHLRSQQAETDVRVREMAARYEGTIAALVEWQRGMAQTDGIMRQLITYFLSLENGKKGPLGMGQAQPSRTPPTAGPSLEGLLNPLDPNPLGAAPPSALDGSGRPGMPGAETAAPPSGFDPNNPFLAGQEAQQFLGGPSYDGDIARAAVFQMAEVSRRAADAPTRPLSRQDALSQMQELARLRNAAPMPNLTDGSEPFNFPPSAGGPQSQGQAQGSQQQAQGGDPLSQPPLQPLAVPAQSAFDEATRHHEGLAVYTVGHLLPRSGVDDTQGTWKFDPESLAPGGMALDGAMGVLPNGVQVNGGYVQQPTASRPYDPAREVSDPGPSNAGNSLVRPPSTLRVRRQTFVPGWSIPPRVLVVDDDQVNRSLSTKFLQVFGCTIDVAVDGVGAVNKMNLEKYDLVLMDIVMPKLDGVAATSMIRQFDPSTPIISMTSASRPDDIMNYINHGMNDILPKPFSKEGLLDMLEKHLMHLKVIKEKGIPRGLTPGPSGETFQVMGHPGAIDPLTGLGLDPERYAAILQSMVSNESFAGVPMVDMSGMGVVLEHPMEKRARDDSADGREPKRPRFEEIE